MSVARAQAEIDSAEFAEWVAFNSLERFTVDHSEYLLAVIASMFANVHRRQSQSAFKPEDFMPRRGRRKDSGQSLEIKLRALLNGNH